MLAAERIVSKHRQLVGALAEPVHADRHLGVFESSAVVACDEPGLGGVQPSPEDPCLVNAAELLCPVGVRLIFEQLTPDQREGLLEASPSNVRRCTRGALEQGVEAIEIE